MDPAPIQDRRALARHLQTQMIAARLPFPPAGAEDGEPEAEGRTAVKTYLLEAHAEDALTRDPFEFFRTVAGQLGLHVEATRDPELLWFRRDGYDFWCDTSLGRYWRLHTIAPVATADVVRNELVTATPWLDNVWLPPTMLEDLAERTESRMQTFSLNHNRRPLLSPDAQVGDLDYVSMRLWASRAAETLARIREADIFPHGVSIRSVRVRTEAQDDEGEFCVSEYFHTGKVTVTGNSFDVHNGVVIQVIRAYRELVEGIEQRYGLGYDGEPPRLKGDHINLELQWTVEDLEFAVARMFASTEPFRLWALPELVGHNRYRARGVDLHVGQTLTFEIGPDNILIQLPHDTCGNTIVRFIAGLQYHLNSDAGKPLLQSPAIRS